MGLLPSLVVQLLVTNRQVDADVLTGEVADPEVLMPLPMPLRASAPAAAAARRPAGPRGHAAELRPHALQQPLTTLLTGALLSSKCVCVCVCGRAGRACIVLFGTRDAS